LNQGGSRSRIRAGDTPADQFGDAPDRL